MRQKGQSLVEFAFSSVALILTLVVIFELGRVMYAYILLQNAANTGARYAITGQFDEDYNADATYGWVTGSQDPFEQVAPCWPLFPDDPLAPTNGFVGEYQPYRDARTCSVEAHTLASMRTLALDPQANYWAGEEYGYLLIVRGMANDASPTEGTYSRQDTNGTWAEYDYSSQYTAAEEGSQRAWVQGFAGGPDDKVAVTIRYNLPLMSLFFDGVVVPLSADVILTNESFGGTTLQREAVLPPEAPPLPELLPPTVDLVVSQIDLQTPPLVAQTPYTIDLLITNRGSQTLDAADLNSVDVRVYASTTQLPATAPLPSGTVIGASTLPGVELKGSRSLSTSLTIDFSTPGDYYVYAWVDSSDEIDEDASTNNPNLEANNVSAIAGAVTVVAQPADLELTKDVDNKTPLEDSPLAYTLTLTNNGPGDAADIEVTDVLPDAVTHLSDDSGGAYDPTTGLWQVDDLDSGQSVSLTINVQTKPDTNGETITNEANITGFNTTTTDPDLDNNTASVTSIVEAVNIELVKTVDNPTPLVGETITYTLTVTNTSQLEATNVAVEDELPTGLNVIDITPTTGNCIDNSGTIVCAMGNLNANSSETVSIQAQVTNSVSSGDVINQARSLINGAQDVFPADSRDQASFRVQAVDLTLNHTASVNFVQPTDSYSYTITLTNDGPDDATNIVVQHTLPADVSYTGHDASAPDAFDMATGQWSIASLPAGDTISLTLNVDVTNATSGTTLTATAATTSLDQRETAPADNTASVDVQVAPLVDLTLTASFTPDLAFAGDTVDYKLTLTNNGPLEATDIVVDVSGIFDLVSNGDLVRTGSPPSGVNVGQQTWSVASLADGASVSVVFNDLTIEPITQMTTLTASAAVDSLDQVDPNPADNTANADLLVVQPVEIIIDNDDLEVTTRGVWTTSAPPDGPQFEADFLYDGQSGKGRKTVTYTINVPYTHTYDVYIWVANCSQCVPNPPGAPVDIIHANGTDTLQVDQQDADQGGQWILLGAYEFDKDEAGQLVIRTDNTQGFFVTADAIRIVSQ